VTGKLFNHKQEIMQSAQNAPGIMTHFKQILGSGIYPLYADREENLGKIWELCRQLTGEYKNSYDVQTLPPKYFQAVKQMNPDRLYSRLVPAPSSDFVERLG